MSDRRTQIAEAALTVVASAGLKGLTHRAVDAAAAVPPGTTSNYFRNRAALVAAVAGRIEQLDLALWASLAAGAAPGSVEELADQLADLVGLLTGEHATLTAARLAMSLDQPEAAVAGHRRLLGGLEQVLAALAVPEARSRARAAADYADGLMLHALTVRRDEPLDRAAVAATLRRVLGD
ncbi:TetR/AcrR family transcriptional regulator [Georgenia thermotolerans]|uniref:TetR family transcriptional regulator n=1 Tax=Georgenia thermotolerans TaxID=527326 RepID=A0A7J5UT12_9MICO|nr:TetR family transcriptional regulator [Georgenia thermotolerans]KAE8765334.1 TetR family transcriptional regulator [Georgenia thermotolerans]